MRKTPLLLVGLISLLALLAPIRTTLAISYFDLEAIFNGTEYYEGTTNCLSSYSPLTSSITVTARERFEAYKPAILELKGKYEAALEGTTIPWQLFAAIHYREARNNPERSIFAGEPLGTINDDNHVVYGETLEDNLSRAVLTASKV